MKLFMTIGLLIVIIVLVGVGIRFYSITRGLAKGRQVVINEFALSRIDDGFTRDPMMLAGGQMRFWLKYRPLYYTYKDYKISYL